MNLNKTPDSQLSPRMLNLVKQVDPLLEQHGLTGHVARVGLILDWSGSMDGLYRSGQMQQLVERLVALGHRFDDDGQIDLFAYHNFGGYIGTLSVNDCDDVASRIRHVFGGMGGTTYSAGIRTFRKHAGFGEGERTAPPSTPEVPYYLCFVTDGANDVDDKNAIISQFRALSYEPVFVQCIALGVDYDPAVKNESKGGWLGRALTGGSNPVPNQFELLARLDNNVPGRLIDNSNFFATKSPTALDDKDFFSRMMAEYPDWLKQAKAKGLVK